MRQRNGTPSSRWLRAFDAAFIAAGGTDDMTTLSDIHAHALALYQNGATAAAAGYAAATAYLLRRQAEEAGMPVSAYIRQTLGID